jgi:SAM-dependent methyltransferase
MYRLFTEFAQRYDLHTPAGHYKHDHATVIAHARRHSPSDCRLLDIGCGTGVFLQAALLAGIDGYGIDAAPEMLDLARQRLGGNRVRVERMQELSAENEYDVICSLSWVIHYCESSQELQDVIKRCHRALRNNGLLIIQVANDEQMDGAVNVDIESGPNGELSDTVFVHKFHPLRDSEHRITAQYVYVSRTHKELLAEHHALRFGSPLMISSSLWHAGFREVSIINPTSISPFVLGRAF